MKTRTRLPLVALAFALSSTFAAAETEIPSDFGARLEPMLEWSETHSPMIASMQAEVEAKRQQIIMARGLDDPMLGIEWRDIDSGSPTLNPSQVGSMKYTISQQLPLWGSRDLKGRVAQANADQAENSRAATRLEVRAQIRQAYADRYRAAAAQRINTEIDHLLEQMEGVARQRYQIGQAGQADIIRLQTERSMLRNEQLALEGVARQANARLAVALNVPLNALTGTPAELPAAPQGFDAAAWTAKVLANNPDLVGARQAISSAQAQRELAQLNTQPGVNVRVSAIQTQTRISMYELMLEVQLPLQGQIKQAERAEAAAMLSRARTQEIVQARQIEGEVNAGAAMLATARAQAELLDKTLFPQAELGFQSTLSRYQNGKGEFASLLESQQQIRRLRQMRLMAELDQFQAWSGLLKMAGEH